MVIADIEDICQICEPLTSFEGVTSYPMKPNRKKAREELDIVSVIEWQSSSSPEDRLFLLTKRPEGGKKPYPVFEKGPRANFIGNRSFGRSLRVSHLWQCVEIYQTCRSRETRPGYVGATCSMYKWTNCLQNCTYRRCSSCLLSHQKNV